MQTQVEIPQPQARLLGAALVGPTVASAQADSTAVNKLVSELQSSDDAVRGVAWQGAAALGSLAVKPLAALMVHHDFEMARSAKRALWRIVRHAARPKAGRERKAVQAELVALFASAPVPVRREALWMLSEIGDSSVVGIIAKLLLEQKVPEEARCALERMPGPQATRALEQALRTAPEDFRFALANSLRVRGLAVKGYPTQKLLPTRQTSVKPK